MHTLLIFGVAALVYSGSCTFVGMDLAVLVSLDLRAGMVLASAFTGSCFSEDLGTGSGGSCSNKACYSHATMMEFDQGKFGCKWVCVESFWSDLIVCLYCC